MRRLPLLGLVLVGAACASLKPKPVAPTVMASGFAVDFPRVGEAVVDAEVLLPKEVEQLSRVTWRLKVKGFLFASGVEGEPFVVRSAADGARTLALHMPLVAKHLSWREGAGYVTVQLSGVVEGRAGPLELSVPFEAKREVLAQNVPRLDVGED